MSGLYDKRVCLRKQKGALQRRIKEGEEKQTWGCGEI